MRHGPDPRVYLADDLRRLLGCSARLPDHPLPQGPVTGHLSPDLLAVLTRTLGPQYQLGEEIGRGGMGVVFRATDRTLQRDVAVKVLNPDLAGHGTSAARFLAEARLVARLRHPNILPVHAAGEAEGLLYYVMDYIAGETLRARLQRDPRLTPAQAAHIAADIASALEVAAAAGIVHRDVKPENILLDGTGPRALLTDFGVARALEGNEHGTGPGVAMGTPAYMSPEQAAGEEIDTRSDLYSLGVVTYEMLAGRPPFDGPNRVLLSRQIIDPPVPVSERRADIPPALDAAVMHALEKVPEDRYQTAAEFRAALLADRPVTPTGAPAATRSERRRRQIRRQAAGFAAMAGLVALAIWLVPSDRPPEGLNPRQSVLILPFDNLRDDPEFSWLRDGSVSMLALSLSQWRDLTVVDAARLHDLLERSGGRDRSIGLELARRLARQAGVWTVVLGDYTVAGDSLLLVARTYDVATGARVDLAQVAGVGTGDIRPLFDELARRLLDISAGADARVSALSAVTTWSLEAYRAYLSGVHELTHWNLAEAETALDRAVALDSSFALALFRLALTRGWRYGEGDSTSLHVLTRAARHADRLPERERTLISAYRSMLERDYGRSVQLYGQLLARDSTDADAWYGLGDAVFHDPAQSGTATGRTRSLRALRRAVRLDPRYVLAYEHMASILAEAAQPQPVLALVGPDSLAAARDERGAPSLDPPGLRTAVLRARAEGVALAQSWVEAQPETPRAHQALYIAQLTAEHYPAALQEARRIAGLLPEETRGFASLLEARVRFASGDPAAAGRAVREGLAALRPTPTTVTALGGSVLQNVLTGANILAYVGDVAGAAQVIAVADTVRRTMLAPESSRPGPPSGVDEVWAWARLAQLYSAAGGHAPELRAIWGAALEASRTATPEQRRSLARSVAAAPIGLFLLEPGSPTPLRELERLSESELEPSIRALEALHRGDSSEARRLVAASRAPTHRADQNGMKTTDPPPAPPAWGFANNDPRPLTADLLYQLGEFAATIEVLDSFQPDQLRDQQFDPRWALLGQVRLLRGLAYERLGNRVAAARQFEDALAQWRQADAVLLPRIEEARTGLARVRGSVRGEASSFE